MQPKNFMKDFKKACIYQIYPKSFYDQSGDGIGDLAGITEKLDYLKDLGIDTIWITPFFTSPQNDNGYDVANYHAIDPIYGTMEDFERLSFEARKRNIGIMLDMVFNHTSIEHEWFQKALSGDPYYKDFYIFRKGQNNEPPTNWISKFGGTAWEYVESLGEYYLHLYDKTQADLNWENENVRNELVDILKFWMSKGVSGFRFDVINVISKPSVLENDYSGDGRRFYTDGPHVHEFLKELCKKSGLNNKGMVTVGEMSSTTMEHCIRYSNPEEQELSMCFNFHHLKVDYKDQKKWELQDCNFAELKSLFHQWQTGMQNGNGWNAVFWCNHDQPRIISRFGDDKNYPKESATMLATMIHCMRGTPYIYQGEELGMTNAYFTDINQYRDVESLNYYQILKEEGKPENEIYHILQERSRDNSRTPMQWNNSQYAGFSSHTPWISVNPNYETINAAACLSDSSSILAYYKKLIALRKHYDVIAYGDYIPCLEDHSSLFAYKRVYKGEQLLVLTNFYGKATTVSFDRIFEDGYDCLLTNYTSRPLEKEMTLQPYEALVFYKKTAVF